MGGYKAERPPADPAMPADELILADRAFQPRQPSDQHHHDQHQVRARETCEPARADQQPAARGQRAAGLARYHRAKNRAAAEAGQRGARINNPGTRRRSRPPPGRTRMRTAPR